MSLVQSKQETGLRIILGPVLFIMTNKYLEKIAERVHPIDEMGAVTGGVLTGMGTGALWNRKLIPTLLGTVAGSYIGHKGTKAVREKLTDYLVSTR